MTDDDLIRIKADVDVFQDDVPSVIIELIDVMPFVTDKANQELTKEATEGKCMTCFSHLGEHTVLVLTGGGIVAAFCGGTCSTDMTVIGWLQETHGDLVQQVNFRGGTGDVPEEEDEDEG